MIRKQVILLSLLAFIVVGITFSSSAYGDVIAESVNGAASPTPDYYYGGSLVDIGWMYTPASSYALSGVMTKFGPCYQDGACASTMTLVVESSPGGAVLASASFAPSAVGGELSGATFASPIPFVAGTPYFIGFEGVTFWGVNITYDPPGATELTRYWDYGGGTFDQGTWQDPVILLFLTPESTAIAEPSSLLLLGTGLAALAKRLRERLGK